MKNLSEALIKFQSELKPIEKDAENPFFKSDYLTLAGILKNVLPILTKNGLSVIQPMRVEGDKTILQTKLTHSSGESVLSEMIMPTVQDPQKYGSLITYYKRYQLQAMLGISATEDDDDCQSVSQPQFKDNSQNSAYVKGEPSEQQKKAMWAIAKANNIEVPKINTFKEASEWIESMNKRKK
jgi:hypothetical protein